MRHRVRDIFQYVPIDSYIKVWPAQRGLGLPLGYVKTVGNYYSLRFPTSPLNDQKRSNQITGKK